MYSNLKRFNYTSLAFSLPSFLLGNAGPIISTVKRGISFHFEICIGEACITAACTSLNVWSRRVGWVHVVRHQNLQDATASLVILISFMPHVQVF